MNTPQLLGFHHLTAVSARIRDNKRFYTEALGMRLVKRSVNQDDTSAYHLFYSDGVGSPGNDLTFFDWPVAPERRGGHTVTRTGLRVRDIAALEYWHARLADLEVRQGVIGDRDGRPTLDFEDPEGQRLAFVVDGGLGDPSVPWAGSAVPAEHQIRGLGPIVVTIPNLNSTDRVLREVLGMNEVRAYPDPTDPTHSVHVYVMGADAAAGPHTELHVAVRPDLRPAYPGAGGVHHVALRTPDEANYHAWTEHLTRLGVRHSGEVDRYYFRSLYFREPAGILFEIATDGPGFAVDEPVETLGEAVALPPFLEPRRAQIVAALKPLD